MKPCQRFTITSTYFGVQLEAVADAPGGLGAGRQVLGFSLHHNRWLHPKPDISAVAYLGQLSAVNLCAVANDWINRLHSICSKEKNMRIIMEFLRDDQGQDLIEYTLLLAFVCLASAALFISAGGSVAGIWTSANSDLATANTSAS